MLPPVSCLKFDGKAVRSDRYDLSIGYTFVFVFLVYRACHVLLPRDFAYIPMGRATVPTLPPIVPIIGSTIAGFAEPPTPLVRQERPACVNLRAPQFE